MLKIIFAGTPEFACPSLQALLDSEHKIVAVYTQPDRRSGRGRKLTPSPVKRLAQEHQIPVFQPETLRDSAEQEILKAFNADLMVVVAYGLLLPEVVLATPRYGCINVHASLLPRWRGAAPIQRAIQAGDEQTGVTIMQMEAGLDTGPMLNTITCSIRDGDTAADLHDKLAILGADALLMAIDAIESGRAKPQKQEDSQATYAKKLEKAEAQLDWRQNATAIDQTIRAFYPWPIAFSEIDDQTVRIIKALPIAQKADRLPGEIIQASSEGIDVACGSGVLRILEMQLPNAKALAVADILNSKKEMFAKGKRFVFAEKV